MHTEAFSYEIEGHAWSVPSFPALDSTRTLVLAFGAPEIIDDPAPIVELARAYPRSIVVGCSTSGEIAGPFVNDHTLSVTVSKFEATDLAFASVDVADAGDSFVAGETLAKKLLATRNGLRAVFVLSEGLHVNGSELVRGLSSRLDAKVTVTGGLAGDGSRFERTWVAAGPKVKQRVVVAIGFYGPKFLVSHASRGGWDGFGPERVVTKSAANVLYELDGKPALVLYKEYLGDKAKGLPASGLLFPLSVRANAADKKVLVRTLLAVDHEKNSLTFAGDIPQGSLVQLMKSDFESLIDAAGDAAGGATLRPKSPQQDSLAVAVSCVGRRLVLGARAEEELEALLEALPHASSTKLTGFYSYGEICPFGDGFADLHNQTMTLSLFSEDLRETASPPKPISRTVPSAPPPLRPIASRAAPPMAPVATQEPSFYPDSHVDGPTVASSQVGSSPFSAHSSGATRPPLGTSDVSGAAVDLAKQGDITVVSVRGRLSESFRGEAVGEKLSGTVVFDLAEVERITSFGVREWLAMLDAAKRVTNMYLARCSEAVVTQLGMIRKFGGSAKVLSFYAPYLCEGCGQSFERLFRVDADATSLGESQAPPTPCPFCNARGRLDDDAETYLGFARAHVGAELPDAVVVLHEALLRKSPSERREIVDKTVEGDITRVRVHTKLTRDVRWKRVFDGLEGIVVLDLGSTKGTEPEGVEALAAALFGLEGDVEQLSLERTPEVLARAFAAKGLPPRVKLTSLTVEGYCASCASRRSALLVVDAHREALAAGRSPNLLCKRCSGALDYTPSEAMLPLFRSRVRDRTSDAPPALASVVAPPATVKRPAAVYALGGAVALLTVALGASWLGGRSEARSAEPQPVALPSAVAAPVASAAAALPAGVEIYDQVPPAWTERAVAVESDRVTVIGHERGSDLANALDGARKDAVVGLVFALKTAIAASPMGELLEARGAREDRRQNDAVAQRFTARMGAVASPERQQAAVRQHDGGVEAYVRYSLSRTSFDEAAAQYRKSTAIPVVGLTVSRYFPLLEQGSHSDGELVVVGAARVRPGELSQVRVGDVLRAVGGRTVSTPEGAAKAFDETWAATAPGSAVKLDVESNGIQRSLSLFKPAR